jgi:triosephosphate isomerase
MRDQSFNQKEFTMRKKMAAGNWKMNGMAESLDEITALAALHQKPTVDILICPPATLLARAAEIEGALKLGGQDCHEMNSGAHTGDISAPMLADAGAEYVIVGHSERRTDHNESSATVRAKTNAAWHTGLTAVVCIGETLAQREAGETNDVLAAQLTASIPQGANGVNTVVAYEPVWAIGTGKTPSLDEIADAHGFIRAHLASRHGQTAANGIRILYGGSVKPDNAEEIFELDNVDGALVGGASLKAEDFTIIVTALEGAD